MRTYGWAYLKDRLPLLLLQVSCMTLLAVFLRMTGYPQDECLVILICWAAVLAAWLFAEYQNRKKYFKEMQQALCESENGYLLGELMPRSFRLEDKIYRELIRKSNKAVIEQIRRIEGEKQEYREFVEGWIHEIKAPITSIALICENNKNTSLEDMPAEVIRRIGLENQRVEHFVEMALYYARSDEVYKDYVIREADLHKLAAEAILKNRYDLMQNHVQVTLQCEGIKIRTDEKWIQFILCQLIVNSIKYRSETNAHIWIRAAEDKDGVRLAVKDNGIGIRKEELPRIFDKGFTGTNGHEHRQATGMGLYLCRKLCAKLGIGVCAESRYGEGTEIKLEFPINSYVVLPYENERKL